MCSVPEKRASWSIHRAGPWPSSSVASAVSSSFRTRLWGRGGHGSSASWPIGPTISRGSRSIASIMTGGTVTSGRLARANGAPSHSARDEGGGAQSAPWDRAKSKWDGEPLRVLFGGSAHVNSITLQAAEERLSRRKGGRGRPGRDTWPAPNGRIGTLARPVIGRPIRESRCRWLRRRGWPRPPASPRRGGQGQAGVRSTEPAPAPHAPADRLRRGHRDRLDLPALVRLQPCSRQARRYHSRSVGSFTLSRSARFWPQGNLATAVAKLDSSGQARAKSLI